MWCKIDDTPGKSRQRQKTSERKRRINEHRELMCEEVIQHFMYNGASVYAAQLYHWRMRAVGS